MNEFNVFQDIPLKKNRENARVIVKIGLDILKKKSKKKIDKWSLREKVLIAGLDTNDYDVCENLLEELDNRFPNSQRIKLLKGLYFEALGKSEEAENIYNEIVKFNDSDLIAKHRVICSYINKNDLNKAIELLTSHVDIYQADTVAWKQLALLYMITGQFSMACYCIEELILTNPRSYLTYVAYAECQYTIGVNTIRYLDARKYYCYSLMMNSNSLRALLGLAITTYTLHKLLQKDSSKKKNVQEELSKIEKNKNINLKVLDRLLVLKTKPGIHDLVLALIRRISIS